MHVSSRSRSNLELGSSARQIVNHDSRYVRQFEAIISLEGRYTTESGGEQNCAIDEKPSSNGSLAQVFGSRNGQADLHVCRRCGSVENREKRLSIFL